MSSQFTKDIYDHDIDRALSLRFAPSARRRGLGLLIAFDAELEKIREQTTEPLLQRIRMQFWREALEDKRGNGHPLAREIITLYGMNSPVLGACEALIDAHENSMVDGGGDGLPEGNSLRQAALFHLSCVALGDKNQSPATFDELEQFGLAYGGALGLCSGQGVSDEDPGQSRDLLSRTQGVYGDILSHLQELPKSVLPAFLPLALVPSYLDLFQSSDKQQDRALQLHPVKKAWQLWRVARNGF